VLLLQVNPTVGGSEVRSSKEYSTVAEAVRHPLRVRILEVLNEQDMSPTEFVEAGYVDFFFAERPSVSDIAYHFRELADFGCLEGVAQRKARGSVATTYRGVARAAFVGKDWTDMSDKEQRAISRTVAQGLIARIDGAMSADTFNSRDDRQLSWFAMQVDERGWREAAEVLADAYYAVDRIRRDADARLKETGEKGMTATTAILIFESPAPTPPRRVQEA
jgi:DNA-binding transcriptional ArsR family regulator